LAAREEKGKKEKRRSWEFLILSFGLRRERKVGDALCGGVGREGSDSVAIAVFSENLQVKEKEGGKMRRKIRATGRGGKKKKKKKKKKGGGEEGQFHIAAIPELSYASIQKTKRDGKKKNARGGVLRGRGKKGEGRISPARFFLFFSRQSAGRSYKEEGEGGEGAGMNSRFLSEKRKRKKRKKGKEFTIAKSQPFPRAVIQEKPSEKEGREKEEKRKKKREGGRENRQRLLMIRIPPRTVAKRENKGRSSERKKKGEKAGGEGGSASRKTLRNRHFPRRGK